MSAFGSKADMAYSGKSLLRSLLGVKRTWPVAMQMSAFDPKQTLAVHCGNGFDAGFSPYQSTRLSRYNAGSLAWGGRMRRREFVTFIGSALPVSAMIAALPSTSAL